MVKRRKILIPEPRSKFVLVKCPDCENEQVVFDRCSMEVKCLVCGRVLARPTGGKAVIEAKIVKFLD